MPRIAILIFVLLLLVGLVFFLSSQASEVPVTTIETDVSQDQDAR